MKESSDILDRIELYSKGKMSLEEKLAFETDLASDNALRDQFEFSRIVDQMVIVGEALKLKEQMGKDLNKPKTKVRSYLAVSLFVLSAGTGLFLMLNKKEDNKALVTNQVSVNSNNSKVLEQAQIPKIKQPEIQDTVSKVAAKPVINQEKKINKSVNSYLPNTKSISIQTVSPVQLPTTGSEQAVNKEQAVSKSEVPLVVKKDLCAGLIGEVEFYAVSSCKGQETGEVYLKPNTVKGGQGPFTFTLAEKSSPSNFNHLPPGQYSLFIRDANGCLVENVKKVVVAEKKCQDKKEYVFNPEHDQSWPIPYDLEKQAVSLVIHEKGGKEFFRTSVSASQPTEWKGESNTGMTLGMGIYFFTIEYADRSVDEGSIVVSR